MKQDSRSLDKTGQALTRIRQEEQRECNHLNVLKSLVLENYVLQRDGSQKREIRFKRKVDISPNGQKSLTQIDGKEKDVEDDFISKLVRTHQEELQSNTDLFQLGVIERAQL